MPSPEKDARVPAFQAVIFDFEGTLVDFQWKLEEGEAALRAAFSALGFPETLLAGENYSTMWNRAVTEGTGRPGADEERGSTVHSLDSLRTKVGPVYDRYDRDALSRWSLRAGFAGLLEDLREKGALLGLVSNVGRLALLPALARLGLQDRFDRIVSRDDVRLMKPAPEGILSCLEGLGLGGAQVLFVGDSRTDVLAARSAGLPVAIILGGESSREALAPLAPDYVLEEPRELLPLVLPEAEG
jgi:HAD superfamily hydrolase (TIGR01509 family)